MAQKRFDAATKRICSTFSASITRKIWRELLFFPVGTGMTSACWSTVCGRTGCDCAYVKYCHILCSLQIPHYNNQSRAIRYQCRATGQCTGVGSACFAMKLSERLHFLLLLWFAFVASQSVLTMF